MLYFKTITLLVIDGVVGTTKKETDKYIDKIVGRSSLYEILKNCTL